MRKVTSYIFNILHIFKNVLIRSAKFLYVYGKHISLRERTESLVQERITSNIYLLTLFAQKYCIKNNVLNHAHYYFLNKNTLVND